MFPSPDVLIPQCSEQLVVYLTHVCLILRVTALPGQHFSHVSSKSGLTNQSVILGLLSPKYTVQSMPVPNGLQQKANAFAPGCCSPCLEANNGWITWNGHVGSNTSPQWDTLGNVDLPWRDMSPRRGGWSWPSCRICSHLAFHRPSEIFLNN